MAHRSLAPAVFLATFLGACAGTGYQRAAWPDEAAPVAADRCRVYVARQDGMAGTGRHVRVIDGETEIGAIGENEYLCWDRPAGQALGTLYYEGLAPDLREVENVFDLPREGGSTTWFGIEIPHSGRQPRILLLTPAEGQALVARRRPAKH